jgi:hypothetical protein
MPLYEYISKTGKIQELHRPVEDRNKDIIIDGSVFKRSKFIPDTLVVFGSQPSQADAFDANILKRYYQKEQTEGSRFRSGYSKKQLAKVYAHARKLT